MRPISCVSEMSVGEDFADPFRTDTWTTPET
jgi:hypothetical protein